jgi:PAS domain S-box-containing protein
MEMLRNTSLGARFNLILILIFAILLAFNALDDYFRQNALIRQDAVDTSRMMARQIIETRSYLSSVLKDEARHNQNLIPQVASTRIASSISKDTRYTIRQTSLRYRNPENKPDSYEAAVLAKFNKSRTAENFEVVKSNGNEVFRYLVPMIADQSCLECHGTYESAPDFVQRRFPKGHSSYNYKVGEIIGAISVSIPMADLFATIGKNLKSDLLYSGVIVFLILLLTATLIRRFIIAPVSRLSETLSNVAKTGAFDTKLPVTGNDEISRLIITYNSMIEELNSKNLQRQESDDRYRNMIEMARSAIVTFIMNGRIVIVNRSAEKLLGISRGDLIGAVFFDCLVNGDSLKNELEKCIGNERPWEGSTFRQQIKDIRGNLNEVELAISATISDGHPIFTAIIRETGQI